MHDGHYNIQLKSGMIPSIFPVILQNIIMNMNYQNKT